MTIAPKAASTTRLAAIAGTNNPRFWDPKIHTNVKASGIKRPLVSRGRQNKKGGHAQVQPEGLPPLCIHLGVKDWEMKHLLDPQGHYNTIMKLFNLYEIPVVVPNVCDTKDKLFHLSEYSEKLTAGLPVAVEIDMYLWTFAPDTKRPTGSRIY
ncbi:hypothetical protein P692DRAFT_20819972 [Suillus brevipes Sb2]|nr:hypothetical protein P692DRAFT_20819972 [Suillus brevipes Sb2]